MEFKDTIGYVIMYTLMVCAAILVVYLTGSIVYSSISSYKKNNILNKGVVDEAVEAVEAVETVSSIKVGVTEIPISYLKRYDGYKHMRITMDEHSGYFGIILNAQETLTSNRNVDEVILELLVLKEELSKNGFWIK